MNNTLDLHGIKHEHVFQIVDQFIGHHILIQTREVSIITGHSVKMKELVEDIAKDYKATTQEEWMNPGKLILSLK
jgi:DNA-nicking Smr family endonuclease